MTEYRHRRRVQFYETDMAGIVHFSWYLRYMEEAEHALWRAAGLSIAPPGAEIGFPRVAASVEFHAPLHFEDEFEVRIRVDALTRRSIRYACDLTRGDTKIATGAMTSVCVRKQPGGMEAIEIPEAIVARLQSGNHGGHGDR